jgi:hypothetical protein
MRMIDVDRLISDLEEVKTRTEDKATILIIDTFIDSIKYYADLQLKKSESSKYCEK